MRRRLPWWRLSDFRWAFKGVRASGDLLGIACDLLSLLPVFVFAVSATGQHNFSVARAAAPSQWNATRPRRKAAGTRNGAPSNTARRRLARSSFRYRVVIALRYRRSARFRAAHWSKPFLITGNFFHSKPTDASYLSQILPIFDPMPAIRIEYYSRSIAIIIDRGAHFFSFFSFSTHR